MKLSRSILSQVPDCGIRMPDDHVFAFPEKVLQFGTGVLLRGLPDFLIDKANHDGNYAGRVVVVKSTGRGDNDVFHAQDNLYTHYIRGIAAGETISEAIVNASISRVLSASAEWKSILDVAANPQLELVISNTTEVGLSYLAGDRIDGNPPASFPGKLTACLLERYNKLGGSAAPGLSIIPTELIPDNGVVLRDICVRLARENALDAAFIEWLQTANDFCNSLVDCIVPGTLPEAEAESAVDERGYVDELHISSECFRLWAIETGRPETRDRLGFAASDAGVIVTENISKFRELKLRLLNASHTFTSGLAVLSDFTTVREAMENGFFDSFITSLMMDEIVPSITGNGITKAEAESFAKRVLDRYRNPFIEHKWQSICVQYTSKMAMRCVPLIRTYYARFQKVPQHMASGIAAYIRYMQVKQAGSAQFTGEAWGATYGIHDEQAATLHAHWQQPGLERTVHAILSDTELWGADLSRLSGFEAAVIRNLRKLSEQNPSSPVAQAAILAV